MSDESLSCGKQIQILRLTIINFREILLCEAVFSTGVTVC